MNKVERLTNAFNGKPVDRVPFSFGTITRMTGWAPTTVLRLTWTTISPRASIT